MDPQARTSQVFLQLQQALQAFAAGQTAQARVLAEAVLGQEPGQAEAWHLLGLIACESGPAPSALALLQRAVALAPQNPGYWNSLGIAALEAGQRELALQAFRRASSLAPEDPYLLVNLANLLVEQGALTEALPCYRQALEADPLDAQTCRDYAYALQLAGQVGEAESYWRKSLQLRPQDPDVRLPLAELLYQQQRFNEARELLQAGARSPAGLHLLGLSLQSEGRPEAALAYLRQAVAAEPENVVYRLNLASCLLEMGATRPEAGVLKADPAAIDTALALLQEIVREAPEQPEIHYNLGWALANQERHQEAIAAYQQAIRLRPDYAEAWANLARSRLELLQIQECLADCRKAQALNPEMNMPHLCAAAALLLTGNFQEGFAEYEWRLREKILLQYAEYMPGWTGQDLAGKSLLLVHEQGFGDMIHFARYIALIRARWPDSQLVLQFPAPLVRLFRTLADVDRVTSPQPPAEARYDYFIPLVSLPRLFLPLAPIPAQVPYYFPDPGSGPALPLAGSGLRVGLVWASGSTGATYHKRAMPAAELMPLLGLAGVDWYSLQLGPERNDLGALRSQAPITDLAPLIGDFLDTACLLQQLDLLISVDTACCHLAGALARPVWTLLPFAPDWRWMLNRRDSYWYPSMRLFRQPRPGDWTSGVSEVILALREHIAKEPEA
ncbi:MAG TPA: tetratricopeptide repeat protein [Candidatus Obscuribacterales bacterium]